MAETIQCTVHLPFGLLDSRPRPRRWTLRRDCANIRCWGVAMDVGGWLRGLGPGQYEATFQDNKIDADLLPRLKDIVVVVKLFTSTCTSFQREVRYAPQQYLGHRWLSSS
jgi:hypothetical protein